MRIKLLKISLATLGGLAFFYLTPSLSLAQEPAGDYMPPGSTQGSGTYFEIKDSQYLNVSLQSSQEITATLESIPGLINLRVSSSTDFSAADLNIGGLEPEKTYYKYEDSHKSSAVFVSSPDGSYSWTQDLNQPHHIWFMERKGTIYIGSNMTLSSDLNETVEITANNVTLDCAGHEIKGTGSGFGIYVNNRTDVTIKNCRVSKFSYGAYLVFNFSGSTISDSIFTENQSGIWTTGSYGLLRPSINLLRNEVFANSGDGVTLYLCSNGEISSNKIFDNTRLGLCLHECTNNFLRNNSLTNNRYNFGVYNEAFGAEHDIDTSNVINGKPIYYLVNEKDKIIDSSYNPGYIGVVNSQNITIKDIEINNNIQGVFFDSNSDSKIENVSVSNNGYGIGLYRCLRCNIVGSRISTSDIGVHLWLSSYNIFEKNDLTGNRIGIALVSQYNNFSHDNKIYHNNFKNNTQYQIYVNISQNDSFDNGYPSGGNYFSNYKGVDLKSGPAQDKPGPDGIGDTPYVIYQDKQDNYPLMEEFDITTPEPPQSWSFAIISDLHVGQSPTDGDYGDDGWDDDSSGADDIHSVKNLKETIDFINSNREKYNINFVAVMGDFTDSAELSELNKAKEILNSLDPSIPWIPIIGNHDIWPYYGEKWDFTNRKAQMAPEIIDENGTDKYFYDIFAEQYQELASILPNWEKQNAPSWNPWTNPVRNSYFENFEFDFNGYHFMGLDFNDREIESWPAKGAAAEGNLHDFNSGTWRWLLYNLQEYKVNHPDDSEKVILLAHHPFRKEYFRSFYDFKLLYNIGFSDDELSTMHEALVPYRDEIYALFAGHTHKTYDDSIFGDALKLIETSANVDGPLARLVQFYPDGTIDYSRVLGDEMRVIAHSPVDLEVTDPDGLMVNKQSNGIPGANYFEEDFDGDGDTEDTIQIPERKAGNYQIRVVPESGAAMDATYSLDVETLEDNFGYTPIVLAQDVPLSQIPVQYDFQAQERMATNLSYNGNTSGQYSNSVNLNMTLTDKDGNPMPNQNITFQLGEQTVSTTTNASGIASASLTLAQAPGKYYSVEVNFAGDQDYLPAYSSTQFEILKEATSIKVFDADGFALATTTLKAQILDNDGNVLLGGPYKVEFSLGSKNIGSADINEKGEAKIDWSVDLIPKEVTETYKITVNFTGDENYMPVQGEAIFTLKSAQWLKKDAKDAIMVLGAAGKGDLLISQAIKNIQNSLSDDFWLDSSHLTFFEKDCPEQNQTEIDPEKVDLEKLFDSGSTNGISKNCSWLKSGLKVFGDEYLAVELLQKRISGKPKISDELKSMLNQAISKLVRADELLAKVAIYDAKNIPVQNLILQKIVQNQIIKAEENLTEAKGLFNSQPDKAIAKLTISWLRSQLAIKFANL